MNYQEYLQNKDITLDAFSPEIAKAYIRILKSFGAIVLHLFVLWFLGMILLMIALALPKGISGTFTIVGIFLLFAIYFLYISYFYGYIGQRWRKNPLQKWFRLKRLESLFQYLENENLSNLEKIEIDYVVKPYIGTSVFVGSPTATFNKDAFEKYSHYFLFTFPCEKYPEIKTKIENILSQHSNLKSDINFKKNNSLEIVLYDNFKNITTPGKHSYLDFFQDKNPLTAFRGFEEIIRLF
ncbi:MAG: hypothetical protein WC678_00545 [Parcubacteria group bacterium]|jgi:hypothetical protein